MSTTHVTPQKKENWIVLVVFLSSEGWKFVFQHVEKITSLQPWDFYLNLLLKLYEGFIIKPL